MVVMKHPPSAELSNPMTSDSGLVPVQVQVLVAVVRIGCQVTRAISAASQEISKRSGVEGPAGPSSRWRVFEKAIGGLKGRVLSYFKFKECI